MNEVNEFTDPQYYSYGECKGEKCSYLIIQHCGYDIGTYWTKEECLKEWYFIMKNICGINK